MMRQKVEKKDRWKVPKIWEGGTAFILGGGPSLNAVNFDLIKDRRIIAVNNAYGYPASKKSGIHAKYIVRPWVDVCWFGDERWFWWHRRNLENFKGILATCCRSLHGRHRILSIHRGKPAGIEDRPRYIAWNKCSGNSAINLAYHFGVKTVVLLGFDMRRVNDRANWHDDHPAPLKNPYERFLVPTKTIASDAKKMGLRIVNCTPGSAITKFPIMTLEDFLNE